MNLLRGKPSPARFRALLLALALGGCAASRGLVSDDGPFAWGFGEQPLRVLLGVQETDNVYLGWICHEDRVTVMSPYQDAGEVLRLRSGSAEKTYRLRPMEDVEGGEATTALSDPVLQAFARTGRLSVVDQNGSVTRSDARSRLERSEVERFVAACRTAQGSLSGALGPQRPRQRPRPHLG